MEYLFTKLLNTHLILLFTLISAYCLSQTNPYVSEDLPDLEFEEMYDILISNDDPLFNTKVFNAYVIKAKSEEDTLELAQAFRLRAYNLSFLDGLKSIDSSISIANSIQKKTIKEFDEFMALAHYTKGALLYKNDMNYSAAKEYIKCYEIAKKTNNKMLLALVLIYIADIKAVFGQEDEAIILQRKTLDFLVANQSSFDDFDNIHLFWIEQMSRCFLFNKEQDSAAKYIKKGVDLAHKSDDEDYKFLFKQQEAKLNYYLNHFQKAKDTLSKYSREKSVDDMFYLGMIEGELGNIDKKKTYFLSIDSLFREKNYPLRDNSNEVYQYLLKEAIKNDEKHLVDKYLDRLVYYDSLLLTTQKNLREITLQKFDLPMQEEEKAMLGQVISSQNKWLAWLYIITGAMLIGLSAYYIKYIKAKKRLVHTMNHDIRLNSEGYKRSKQIEENKLDGDTATIVLESLKVWEAQKGFLDNTVTQQTLAKKLNTNSSYLSKVVNTYKGQNFANYLKDLRITHAINHLKENPEIARTKSMIQIAEMYGFNSLGVFSEAFKNKIGVTPGVFFKRVIEMDQQKQNKGLY